MTEIQKENGFTSCILIRRGVQSLVDYFVSAGGICTMEEQSLERATAGTAVEREKNTVTIAEETEAAVMESLEELRIA